jgi:hypothetical protein
MRRGRGAVEEESRRDEKRRGRLGSEPPEPADAIENRLQAAFYRAAES